MSKVEMTEEEEKEYQEWKKKQKQKEVDEEAQREMWRQQAARAKRESEKFVKQVRDMRKPEQAFTQEREQSKEVLKCKRIIYYLLNEPRHRGGHVVMGLQYKLVDDAHNGILRVKTLKDTPERNLAIKNDKYGEPMELHMKYPYPMDIHNPKPLWKIWKIQLENGELPLSPQALKSYAQLENDIKVLNKQYGALKLEIGKINKLKTNASARLKLKEKAISSADQTLRGMLSVLESKLFKGKDTKALIEQIRRVLI